jgi:MscS family membrane protein
LEPLDTSSPRATIFGFLETADDILRAGRDGFWRHPTYEEYRRQQARIRRGLQALDLSEIPPASRKQVGISAARHLHAVLSRLDLPPAEAIPDAKAYEDEEESASYTLPHTEITLVRIENGPRAGDFVFSPETVSRAREFYQRVKDLAQTREVPVPNFVDFVANRPGWIVPMAWIQGLPQWTKRIVLDHGLWKFGRLLVLVLLLLGLLALLSRFLAHWQSEDPVGNYLRRMALPTSIIILMPFLVDAANTHVINLTGDVAQAVALISWVIA